MVRHGAHAGSVQGISHDGVPPVTTNNGNTVETVDLTGTQTSSIGSYAQNYPYIVLEPLSGSVRVIY